MIAFMGRALAGARASSQDFFSFSVSVSAVVGGLRIAVLDEVVVVVVVVVRCGIPFSQRWRRWGLGADLGPYLAAAGFGVAWGIFYVDVLGFGPRRRVEVYDPLRRRWSI